jgi:hypothetical protein
VLAFAQIGIAGGTVGGLSADGTRDAVITESSARWRGSALELENRRCASRDDREWRREVWSLDRAGRLWIEIDADSAAGSRISMTVAYRRQP